MKYNDPTVLFEKELLEGQMMQLIHQLMAEEGVTKEQLAETLEVSIMEIDAAIEGVEGAATIRRIAMYAAALGYRIETVPVRIQKESPDWVKKTAARILDDTEDGAASYNSKVRPERRGEED